SIDHYGKPVALEWAYGPQAARRGTAGGAPSRDPLPAGVEVRDVERERGDEDDREEQEQRDRPLGPPPPRASHARTKAPCAHNGFPDSLGSRGSVRPHPSARRTARGAAGR